MKYFNLNLVPATHALAEVWKEQESRGKERSYFSISAYGQNASVWTEDAEAENLFRVVLDASGADYAEGDEQQVVTPLDNWFSRSRR